MRNITVTVEDQTCREIRAWCAQRDTCVSHVVQIFLKDLPRLKQIHRFPLPEAPDLRSLGSRFNDLYSLKSRPSSPDSMKTNEGLCDCVEHP